MSGTQWAVTLAGIALVIAVNVYFLGRRKF
jgi:hypothetical protein